MTEESLAIYPDTWIAPGAEVSGDVTLMPGANVWFRAAVRGVQAPVTLEECANVQDNCVVEGRTGHPARLGPHATMGHNATVLGATIEQRVLIAMGAVVQPGAHVGEHSIIGANAVVPEGMQVPPRSLVIGHGRVLREVTEAEIRRIYHGGSEYQRLSAEFKATLDRGSA